MHHMKKYLQRRWSQLMETHRINRLVLGEAHWCNAIDAYSQDGDEQMDKGDPVSKKRPEETEKQHHPSVPVTEGSGDKAH